MKITDESHLPRYGNAEIVVRLDPHDGTCRGAHDIIVSGFRNPNGSGPPHVTLSWNTTVVLSIEGSTEFAAALDKALKIALQIRRDGEYREGE
jgi:hypothetical protein